MHALPLSCDAAPSLVLVAHLPEYDDLWQNAEELLSLECVSVETCWRR